MSDLPAEPQFYDSGGVAIAYDDVGSGDAVILIHGFASSRNINWRVTGWYRTLIDASLRVIALDCRGHGDSDKPHDPNAYRPQCHVADVIGLMDHLGLSAASLMGYSLGGRIALRVLLDHPASVDKAVLGGIGMARNDPAFTARILEALAADDPATISDPIARRFRQFADRGHGDREALAACYRYVDEPLDEKMLARVAAPVLAVAGEEDDIAVAPAALAAAIPGAKLVMLPGRDHMSAVGDKRHKNAVLSFLKIGQRGK